MSVRQQMRVELEEMDFNTIVSTEQEEHRQEEWDDYLRWEMESEYGDCPDEDWEDYRVVQFVSELYIVPTCQIHLKRTGYSLVDQDGQPNPTFDVMINDWKVGDFHDLLWRAIQRV